MRKVMTCFTMALFLTVFCGADWLQFRGTTGNAASSDASVPLEWSADKNTAWTADLPGRGPSCPIVVDGRVIVTCSSGPRQDRLHVVCFDAKSGQQLWHRQVWATGRTFTHPFSAVAAPTPASDGERIFAFFASNDLACLDLEGNLLWYRGLTYDFPKAGNDVGMASSPVVAGDTVVVQVECQADSFAAGIDAKTGETRWRIERPKFGNYTSPVLVPGKGSRKDTVLLLSMKGLTLHEPRTGKEIWQLEEPFGTVASATIDGNLAYVPTGGTTALKFSDQSASPEILWQSNRLRSGSSSLVAHDGCVFALNGGVIKCADAETGDDLWQLRIGGKHWATPVIAGRHMYCVSDAGEAHVIELSREQGKIVFKTGFDEPVVATPAIADGALYIRSDKHLWKIAAE